MNIRIYLSSILNLSMLLVSPCWISWWGYGDKDDFLSYSNVPCMWYTDIRYHTELHENDEYFFFNLKVERSAVDLNFNEYVIGSRLVCVPNNCSLLNIDRTWCRRARKKCHWQELLRSGQASLHESKAATISLQKCRWACMIEFHSGYIKTVDISNYFRFL